jgi:molybdopterin/thiamine biosynthesis adenylyltransferase
MSIERYQRHSLVDWFDQQKLSNGSVAVIGAGAVGNEALKNLCLLGVGRIHIVDFDRIEEHNLTRTVLFKSADIGKFKAEAAAAACQQIDPHTRLTFSNSDFWQSLSLVELKHFDAVLCCVDNLEARIRLNQMCLVAQVDMLNAGIDSRNISVEMYPFGTSVDCGCYECWLPPGAYATMRKRYSCGWLKRIAFEERKVPTTAITSSLAGACMTSLFLQRKCEHPDKLNGSIKLTLDSVTLASSVVSIERFDICPACSRFHPDCRLFTAKRFAVANDLSQFVADKNFTMFLSEPVVLGGRCKSCGRTVDVVGVASKFDEGLAVCGRCQQRSNTLRIVDALSYQDLLDTFRDKPLRVKFVYFYHNDQQIILELED